MYKGVLEDIIPHSRRNFGSYEAFEKKNERATFIEELPSSSHDEKYYVYEGFLEDKIGYSMMLSAEDYEITKHILVDKYKSFSEEYAKLYESGENYLDMELLKAKRIDFLDEIISIPMDGEYYILCESQFEGKEIYNYQGVICNDENHEIIEFSYYGPKG